MLQVLRPRNMGFRAYLALRVFGSVVSFLLVFLFWAWPRKDGRTEGRRRGTHTPARFHKVSIQVPTSEVLYLLGFGAFWGSCWV